jgi:hypothetical protein
MPTNNGTAALERQIRRLIDERQKHSQAIEAIDRTLGSIRSLIGGDAGAGGAAGESVRPRRGRPPGRTSAQQAQPAKRGRRRRRRFGVNAEQFVLDFVKGNKNSSTRDINAAWKEQGRGGTADNTLTRLVKEKKLKRKPIEGERGSRYELA